MPWTSIPDGVWSMDSANASHYSRKSWEPNECAATRYERGSSAPNEKPATPIRKQPPHARKPTNSVRSHPQKPPH